jgi:hypothetical protein
MHSDSLAPNFGIQLFTNMEEEAGEVTLRLARVLGIIRRTGLRQLVAQRAHRVNNQRSGYGSTLTVNLHESAG